jgi:transposase, IS5 family
LFEPSTEVIRKGKTGKPTEFGKLVKLQEAENQIVIDYEIYARRPNDVDLLVPAIEIHHAKLRPNFRSVDLNSVYDRRLRSHFWF